MPFFVPKRWNGGEHFMTILHLAHKVQYFEFGCIFCEGEYIFMYFKNLIAKIGKERKFLTFFKRCFEFRVNIMKYCCCFDEG